MQRQLAASRGPQAFFAPPRPAWLIERETGHQALQARVLVFELAHPAHLVDTEVGKLLLPLVEGGLTDADLAANVADRGARVAWRSA